MTKKVSEEEVEAAAAAVLETLPALERARESAPKLFTAAMAVRNALQQYRDVQAKLREAERVAAVDRDAAHGEIEQEKKRVELWAARRAAEAQDEYDRAVNGARALVGTKLQVLGAAVTAFQTARARMTRLLTGATL